MKTLKNSFSIMSLLLFVSLSLFSCETEDPDPVYPETPNGVEEDTSNGREERRRDDMLVLLSIVRNDV